MSIPRRLWRVIRGIGKSVRGGTGNFSPEDWDARREVEQASAEMEKRARLDAAARGLASPSGAGSLQLPEAKAGSAPAASASGTPGLSLPQSAALDPTLAPLAPHYAVLGLRVGAPLEEVERAYRRLKARGAASAPKDAAAEARLEKAYQAIRQGIVRERRL